MSIEFEYYPDPGIVFDISKMLLVKLNARVVWSEKLAEPKNFTKDIKYIESYANTLPTPKPEVLIFSYAPSNHQESFLTYAISNILDEVGMREFSLSKLITYLSNYPLVQKDLFHFYFDTTLSDAIDLDHIIRNNKTLSDKMKLLLFSFFVYPSKYFSPLINIIELYYAQIKNKISLSSIENLDLLAFANILQKQYISSKASNTKSHDVIAYSISYCVPDYLVTNFNSTPPYLISTKFTISNLINTVEDALSYLELSELCHSMSDKIRISIVNLLIDQTSLTLEEISEKTGLSIPSTKYHISLLKKAEIISSKRLQKKNVYSFNATGFKKMKKLLDLIEKGNRN